MAVIVKKTLSCESRNNRAWEKKNDAIYGPVFAILTLKGKKNECIVLSEGKQCGHKIAGRNTTDLTHKGSPQRK